MSAVTWEIERSQRCSQHQARCNVSAVGNMQAYIQGIRMADHGNADLDRPMELSIEGLCCCWHNLTEIPSSLLESARNNEKSSETGY